MAYTTIDDPSQYFNTVLWTGNGGTNAITGVGFKPDWVWGKDRVGTDNHHLFDTTRGTNQRLISNSTAAENTESNCLDSFDSDGFTLGSNTGLNANGEAHVAWNWKANGGTTSSNTDGSITSTVQASTTSGFSIVTWTGTEANGTVGHGLGKRPECIIVKTRGGDENWVVRFKDTITGNAFHKLHLNKTNAIAVDYTLGNMQDTSSSVFYLQNSGQENDSGQPMVAYCFAPIQGYSKFGSYTGNGSTDGIFVHTGFKPAWIMVKATDVDEWRIYDHKRANAFNVINVRLKAHTTAAESQDDNECDFLSNGVKWRSNSGGVNSDGQKYVYMAFAEHPFVSSEGVPVTAR